MFELTIIVNFEAAHCIKGYPGKCNRIHGHNWKVEVKVSGTKLNDLGMLIDFTDLKEEVNKVISKLDHYYLNELEFFSSSNPTAENIAYYIYHELALSQRINNGVKLKSVKIWESPNSAVMYSPEGRDV